MNAIQQILPYYLFILTIIAWTLPWKAYALWKAARNGNKWWFIIFMLVNTVGALEILYIFVFSKEKNDKVHQ